MAGDVDTRAGAALLVGIDRYQYADRIQPLPFAVCDAQALARHLTDPAIGRLAHESVKLLTGESASREELVRGLSKWLPLASRGAEIAIIYFAGHGMVRKGGQQETG